MDKTVQFACLLIFSTITINATAGQPGFYIGGSIGKSNGGGEYLKDLIDEQLAPPISTLLGIFDVTASTKIDDTNMGHKFFAGYNFSPYFGFETAYVRLGNINGGTNLFRPGVAGVAGVAGVEAVEAVEGVEFVEGFDGNPDIEAVEAVDAVEGVEAIDAIDAIDAFDAQFGADAKIDGFTFAAVASYPIFNKTYVFAKAGLFRWNVEGQYIFNDSYKNNGISLTFGAGASYQLTNNMAIRGEWERYEIVDSDINLYSLGLQFNY